MTGSQALHPRRRAALATALLLALTGCGAFEGGDDGGLVVTGDASIVQVAPEDREGPVEASGTSLDGDPVDLADFRGRVVVLNFWGSWCNPCRSEAPILADASEELDAVFVGAQLRPDDHAQAVEFEREYGIDYPTLEDSGATALALGRYAPRTPPSTAILDTQGRVAALISGAITSGRTLDDLVTEVAAEDG